MSDLGGKRGGKRKSGNTLGSQSASLATMSGLDDFYADLEDQEFEDSEEEREMYMDALERMVEDEHLDIDYDEVDEDDDDDDDDFVPDDMDEEEVHFIDEEDDDDDLEDEEDRSGDNPLLEIMALLNASNGLSAEARTALLNRIARSGRISFTQTGQYPQESRYKRWWKVQEEPHVWGVELLRSGDFGAVGPWRSGGRLRPSERRGRRRYARKHVANHPTAPVIPNNPGTLVAEYPGVRAYLGQYAGPDYGIFYSATQDFQLYLYSTNQAPGDEDDPEPINASVRGARDYHDMWGYRLSRGNQRTSLKQIKTVRGIHGQWTITDADADRKAERIIYSSITPIVHMFKTAEHDEEHVSLDFRARPHDQFSIWSIRFSSDGQEVVAGGGSGSIMVYDITSERRILNVDGHNDDVNTVCFADTGSTNILVSGSDDGYVKIWDRRSLSSSTPSGVLPGATQGITYVSPKGDGRYIVANSKDQAARLYDLRKMQSWGDFERTQSDAVLRWGDQHFDYRREKFREPKRAAHPKDCSVMTFRGHSVLRTLIRCHFSPVESTGQRYIYSGSADGLIHIWSLDGRVVQVLDRAQTVPLQDKGVDGRYTEYNDPSAPRPHVQRTDHAWARGSINNTVRDVAWHGYEPTLMSTCWDSGSHSSGGSVAKHEWMGLGKGGLRSLEDWVGKAMAEAAERAR